jgi:Rps23 Pro-64 3,4-dihydroxylase Tpa1-like proline 4-hydroxylase
MRVAIGLSQYIAVRDDHARATLAPFTGAQDIAVVPDTCFGVTRLIERSRPSPALSNLYGALKLTRPYFVIQAVRGLDAFARLVARHPAQFAGYQFVALPLGPALGDDAALIGNDFPNLVILRDYPDPRLIAELLAAATGVIGVSLHLAITAIAFGVPVFRPSAAVSGKYAILSGYANIHSFAAEEEIDPVWFQEKAAQHGVGSEMDEISVSLDRHWDKVASCFSAGRETANLRAGLLWQQLPALLEGRDRIAHLEESIADRSREITQRDEQINYLSATLTERDRRISILDALTTERDTQRATLTERDQRISILDVAVAERDRQLVDAKTAIDGMHAELKACNDELRALLNSNSWKATTALRRIRHWAMRSAAVRSRVVRLKRIAQEPLAKAPYEWAFVNGLFSHQAGESLLRTFLHDNFKTVKGYDGEKGYEYESRALIHMNSVSPSCSEGLSDSWRMLADDLLSPGYRAAMTRLTGHDLSTAPMEAYVCHFGPGAWLGPHVDLKDKILTHVFYFNASWKKKHGGCLNILRSSSIADKVAEISPVIGNSSVLIRSDNSWHSVSRVSDRCRSSRRSMNVIFYRPGAVSTMWPPGDDTPLHRYEPAVSRPLAV